MRKLLILGIFTIISTSLVFGQEAPEEPGIVLPRLMLEVQDIDLDDIQTILPSQEELGSPDIELPLPQPEDLQVDMSSIVLNDSIEITPETTGNRVIPYYASGAIGAGSMNYLMGQIELSMPNSNPDFDLKFSHEAMDGYWSGDSYQSAGSGSYNRQEIFHGDLSIQKDLLTFGGNLDFKEREDGLQNGGGLNEYESQRTRNIDANGNVTWNIKPHWNVLGYGEYSGFFSVLTGTNPYDTNENRVKASGGIQWFSDDVSIKAAPYGQYWSVEKGSKSMAGVEMNSEGAKGTFRYSIDSQLGWGFNDALWSPFHLTLSYRPNYQLGFEVYGGRIQEYYSTSLINDLYLLPTLDLKENLGWTGGISASYTWSSFNLSFNVPYSYYESRQVITKDLEAQSGLFVTEKDDGPQLRPKSTIGYENNGFYTNGGLELTLFEDSWYEDYTKVTWDFGYESVSQWGIRWTNWYILRNSGSDSMPQSNIEGYYKVNQGLVIALEGQDLLSPFISEGRELYGTYLEPGFLVNLQARISF
ncbi:hypothetical protein [Spirochaeta cellobiosiphila]|uniref:hypothetical protein n=1 Tax=Spirochaeta cellobiosiphila TaxID=504483 RepID=UPI0004216468|nr:hypothetical protein [Spirochaeta cellobiosiphila]